MGARGYRPLWGGTHPENLILSVKLKSEKLKLPLGGQGWRKDLGPSQTLAHFKPLAIFAFYDPCNLSALLGILRKP